MQPSNRPNRQSPAALWSTLVLVASLFCAQAQASNKVLSIGESNGYVSIPSAAELQNPNELTVEAWMYPRPKPRPQCTSARATG